MDTFGSVVSPFSPRRPASRDSGLASSRGSSVAETLAVIDYGIPRDYCCDYIPGGWAVDEQIHDPDHQDQDQEPEAQTSDNQSPQEADEGAQTLSDTGAEYLPRSSSSHASDICSIRSISSSSPGIKGDVSISFLESIAAPVLLLMIVSSLDWFSSWSRMLGLVVVVAGMGKRGWGVCGRAFVDGTGAGAGAGGERGRSGWRERE